MFGFRVEYCLIPVAVFAPIKEPLIYVYPLLGPREPAYTPLFAVFSYAAAIQFIVAAIGTLPVTLLEDGEYLAFSIVLVHSSGFTNHTV